MNTTKTRNFTECFQLIYPEIRHLVSFSFWIRKRIGKGGEVVGINANSLSVRKKEETLERVRNEISRNSLPLEVVDTNQLSTQFKIIVKDNV